MFKLPKSRQPSLTGFRHDKRRASDRKKLFGLLVLFVCILIIFRTPVRAMLSSFFSVIARPIWSAEYHATDFVGTYSDLFKFKTTLIEENRRLKASLDLVTLEAYSRESLALENDQLRSALGRSGARELLLALVLATPGRSPYDTLLIDIGSAYGITSGMKVFTDGDFVIGEVTQVDSGGAVVTLYSSPGKEFPVLVGSSSSPAIARGEGGGSFRIMLPKGIAVLKNDLVRIPAFGAEYVGLVSTVERPEGGSLQNVYFKWPFNVNELRLVYIATGYDERVDNVETN